MHRSNLINKNVSLMIILLVVSFLLGMIFQKSISATDNKYKSNIYEKQNIDKMVDIIIYSNKNITKNDLYNNYNIIYIEGIHKKCIYFNPKHNNIDIKTIIGCFNRNTGNFDGFL